MAEKRSVHFISLGCPKNLVDTEIMLGSLKTDNYEVVDSPDSAETVIVNTCGFIEEAKEESISKILELGEMKSKGNVKNLVVAGCLTQRYKDELVESLPEADLFVGSGEFQNISKILRERAQGKTEKKFFNLPTYLQEESTLRHNSQPAYRAYLKISEGCKKRCSFCAIPMIRGNLQSRSVDAIVNEAKLLVAGGTKELIIISHDFTDYGWDLRKKNKEAADSPYNLMKRLSEESGAEWIRVLYQYPDGISDEMIELVRSQENLVNYFDMPLQHINNEMLKRMNRRMSREEIESVLRKIRENIPDAIIRTQFIVGFPGETDDQFAELLDFVVENRFDRVGCFKYSPEEGTKAGKMQNQVDEEIKKFRHDRLMEVQQQISREQQLNLVGQTLPVVVEGYSEETELLLRGRHFGQAPDIDGLTYINEGTANVGDIVPVKITDCHDYDLVGTLEH